MLPDYFEFICPVKILSGRKALSNLPYELSQLGAKRPLIVTDRGVMGAKLIDHVKAVFSDSNLIIGAIFHNTPVDSSDQVVNEVANLFKENNCDSLVAVGGGSVIDTAKGVNIVISEKTNDLLKLQGVDRIKETMLPFIVVPTTAGTGSEVTSVAVIANVKAGIKMAFMSNKLFPKTAILDPIMTMTMPQKITAASGMDALTHAIEAYFCIQKNPVSDSFAISAINLIRDNLIEATVNGKNEKARMAMANAALLAGIAFSNSMVGMIHALAHACGGVAHVPHGVANSILLPFGMEYNFKKIANYLAELAPHLAAVNLELSTEEKAKECIKSVRKMQKALHDACKLPLTLSEAGVKEEQLEKIAKVAINDGAVTYNPEEMSFEDGLEVLKKAF